MMRLLLLRDFPVIMLNSKPETYNLLYSFEVFLSLKGTRLSEVWRNKLIIFFDKMNKQQKFKKLNPYLFNNQSLTISVQQYEYPLQILDIQRDFDFLAANERLQLMRNQIDQELSNLTKKEFIIDPTKDKEQQIRDFRQHIKSISYKAFWPFYDTGLFSKSFSQFYKLTRGSYQQLYRVENLPTKKDDHGSINIIVRFLEKLFEFKKEYIKLSIEGFFFLLIGLYGPAYFHSVYDGVFTLIDITKYYFRDDNLLVLKDQYKDMDLYIVQQILWIYKQIQEKSNKQTVIQRNDVLQIMASLLNVVVDDIYEEFKRQGKFWNYKTDFYEFIKAPEKLMNSSYKFLYGTDISTVIVQVILECLVIIITKFINLEFNMSQIKNIYSEDIICEIVYTRPLFEYYTKIVTNSKYECLTISLDKSIVEIPQYKNIGHFDPPTDKPRKTKDIAISIPDVSPVISFSIDTKSTTIKEDLEKNKNIISPSQQLKEFSRILFTNLFKLQQYELTKVLPQNIFQDMIFAYLQHTENSRVEELKQKYDSLSDKGSISFEKYLFEQSIQENRNKQTRQFLLVSEYLINYLQTNVYIVDELNQISKEKIQELIQSELVKGNILRQMNETIQKNLQENSLVIKQKINDLPDELKRNNRRSLILILTEYEIEFKNSVDKLLEYFVNMITSEENTIFITNNQPLLDKLRINLQQFISTSYRHLTQNFQEQWMQTYNQTIERIQEINDASTNEHITQLTIQWEDNFANLLENNLINFFSIKYHQTLGQIIDSHFNTLELNNFFRQMYIETSIKTIKFSPEERNFQKDFEQKLSKLNTNLNEYTINAVGLQKQVYSSFNQYINENKQPNPAYIINNALKWCNRRFQNSIKQIISYNINFSQETLDTINIGRQILPQSQITGTFMYFTNVLNSLYSKVVQNIPCSNELIDNVKYEILNKVKEQEDYQANEQIDFIKKLLELYTPNAVMFGLSQQQSFIGQQIRNVRKFAQETKDYFEFIFDLSQLANKDEIYQKYWAQLSADKISRRLSGDLLTIQTNINQYNNNSGTNTDYFRQTVIYFWTQLTLDVQPLNTQLVINQINQVLQGILTEQPSIDYLDLNLPLNESLLNILVKMIKYYYQAQQEAITDIKKPLDYSEFQRKYQQFHNQRLENIRKENQDQIQYILEERDQEQKIESLLRELTWSEQFISYHQSISQNISKQFEVISTKSKQIEIQVTNMSQLLAFTSLIKDLEEILQNEIKYQKSLGLQTQIQELALKFIKPIKIDSKLQRVQEDSTYGYLNLDFIENVHVISKLISNIRDSIPDNSTKIATHYQNNYIQFKSRSEKFIEQKINGIKSKYTTRQIKEILENPTIKTKMIQMVQRNKKQSEFAFNVIYQQIEEESAKKIISEKKLQIITDRKNKIPEDLKILTDLPATYLLQMFGQIFNLK